MRPRPAPRAASPVRPPLPLGGATTPPTAVRALLVGAALAAVGAFPGGASGLSAQAEITVEVGASQIGPALGVMADDSHFGMAGLRGSLYGSGGTGIVGSVLAGTALGATDGHFVSGLLEGRIVDHWRPGLEARLEGRLMGFDAATPYPYRSTVIEGGPSLRWSGSDASLEVSAIGGFGLSRIELWRYADGPTRVFENELGRAGGTVELLLGPPNAQFGAVGGWHATREGDYGSVGARAIFAGSWGIAELRADRWTTPFDSEVVAGVAVVIPIGSAWTLRGFFGRTEPDPLTLAQPGTTSGGMMVGRSFALGAPSGVGGAAGLGGRAGASASDLVEVLGSGTAGRRVRFALRPPSGAASVELLGDFSVWEPIGMVPEAGGRWVVEVDVPEGVHHFGFLVDDEWYVPDDAPDVVEDEWGRRSATLVIEGASR